MTTAHTYPAMGGGGILVSYGSNDKQTARSDIRSKLNPLVSIDQRVGPRDLS